MRPDIQPKMRQIEGYVCLARQTELISQERIFGKNMGGGQGAHESFVTNNMMPFETPQEASVAYNELRERMLAARFTTITPAKIDLVVWRPLLDPDQRRLSRSLNLVIVAQSPEDPSYHDLFGKLVPGVYRVGHIPGSLLETNDFSCFNNLSSALHCAGEIERQMQHYAWVGTLNLERIQPGNLNCL